MKPEQYIAWDKAKVKRLQSRYDQAVRDKEEFDDEPLKHEFVTEYAKYFLEYLNTLPQLK